MFKFKQFSIKQDKTAMKVGTDGVLLGAWADGSNTKSILDIGTGTGLTALMMAQRNTNSKITALEIEENAFLQAQENVTNSKWHDRIEVLHTSLQEYQTENKFNLIVSNPPFFNNTFKAENKLRNQARHTESLSFESLLKSTSALLSKNGKSCFIIPIQEKDNFILIAEKNKLFLNKTMFIKGNINSKIVRVLLELSFRETIIEEKTISIEISRHQYTKKYIHLVKDFYLKM